MTTDLATPPAIDTVVADLVLVRIILPSKNPVGPQTVRKDVGKVLGSELSAAELDLARTALASAGLLTQGKRNTFALTDSGRQRAHAFLGVSELPARMSWSTVIAKYLFPKAAGLSAEAAARLDNADKLAAFVLKRKYGLATGAGSTVGQVLEAVACKELGFSDETTLSGLLSAVLSRVMGSERLPKQKIAKQLPLFETGLTGASAEAARCKVVRDWLGQAPRLPHTAQPQPPQAAQPQLSHTSQPSESRQTEPFDLTAFAATVRALAAKSSADDRFHDNKVFIAALWRAAQDEPSFPRMSLAEFKRRLLEANSQSLVHLSRADLVQAMDPQMVAESEAEYLNATFHFVLIEGDHS